MQITNNVFNSSFNENVPAIIKAIGNIKSPFAILEIKRNGLSEAVDFYFKYINKAGASLISLNEKQIIGKCISELFSALFNSELFNSLLKSITNDKQITLKSVFINERLGHINIKGFFDFDLIPEGNTIYVTWNDVTERKSFVERLLEKSNHKNNEFTKYFNENVDDFLIKKTEDLHHTNRLLMKEIKERRNAEVAMRAERQQLVNVLETLPLYLILLTPDHHVSFANRFFRERFGSGGDLRCFEFLFKRDKPCDNCETFKVLETRLPHRWEWMGPDNRYYDIYDFPFIDTDGTQLIMEMGIDVTERKLAQQRLENYHSQLEELIKERTEQLVTANKQLQLEIAERKNTEEELEHILLEVEHRAAELDAILDSIPNGLSIADSEGQILRMNNIAEKILGCKANDLDKSIPERLQNLRITKPDGTPFKREDSPTYKAINGEIIIGTIQLLKDGEKTKWLSVNSAPIRINETKQIGAVTSFTDITESKRIEENLNKERMNLQTLFDVVNVGMLLIDVNGNVKRVNNTLALWLGKDLITIEDLQPGDIVGCVHALLDNVGCGHSEICKSCSVRNTFQNVFITGVPIHNIESELSVIIEGNLVHLWLEISADPVILDGEKYVILCMNNITARKQAETTLKKNEKRLNSILSSIQDGFFELNREGRFTYVNQHTVNYVGVKFNSLIGECIWEVFPYLRGTEYEKVFQKVIEDRLPLNFETKSFIKEQWYEINIYPSESGVSIFWRDINQRKHAEQVLQNLNRTLIALSKSSQIMLRTEDETTYLNEVCKIITEDCGHALVWIGYIGEDEEKIVHPVAYSGFEKEYLDSLHITWSDTEFGCGPTGTAIKTGEPAVCLNMASDQNFIPWRDEAIKRGYASSVALPLKDSNRVFGTITIYSFIQDYFSQSEIELLSELANDMAYGIVALRLREVNKKAEAEIRRSEKQFRSLFNNMTEGFAIHEIITDRDGNSVNYRFLDINPAFEKLTGLRKELVVGKLASEIIPDEDPERIKIYGDVALTGNPAHFENYFPTLNKYFEIYSYQNAPRQFVVIFIDVTNRKLTEKALKINRSRAELLAKTASSLLASDDPQHLVEGLCSDVMRFLDCEVFFNYLVDDSAAKICLNAFAGVTDQEANGVKWLNYGEAICGSVAQQRCRIIAEEIPTTPDPRTDVIRACGVKAYACHPIISQDKLIGTLAFGTRSRTRFSDEDIELMNTVSNLVAIAMNRVSTERALQQSEERFEQLADTMPQLVWTAKPDGIVDYYNKRVNEFGGISKNDDGSWHWSPMVHKDDVESTISIWRNSLNTGKIYEVTHRIRMKDGSYKWFLTRGFPIKNSNGEIVRWFGTGTDIHAQKVSEEILRQTLTELENSNRDLEQFAYIASHDLQEPIRMIKNYSQILERKYKNSLDGNASEFLGFISDGATRMHQLVSDLLRYSRVSTRVFPFVEVDCNIILKEVIEDLRIVIQESKAVINTDILPTVRGDYTQIRQLFQNLIQNAIKFRSEMRPEINITCSKKDDNWFFSISDNGIGIDSMYFDKIFVIFQRLHERERYSGTGIGLALCKKIIERHGGEITVESEVGKSTKFNFTLPAISNNLLNC